MPKMQEHFSAGTRMAGNAENAGAFFGLHEDGGLSRPSMASEGRSRSSLTFAALGLLPSALGLLPGGMPKMQEHFSAGAWMARCEE
jgi:hypothetical protein